MNLKKLSKMEEAALETSINEIKSQVEEILKKHIAESGNNWKFRISGPRKGSDEIKVNFRSNMSEEEWSRWDDVTTDAIAELREKKLIWGPCFVRGTTLETSLNINLKKLSRWEEAALEMSINEFKYQIEEIFKKHITASGNNWKFRIKLPREWPDNVEVKFRSNMSEEERLKWEDITSAVLAELREKKLIWGPAYMRDNSIIISLNI